MFNWFWEFLYSIAKTVFRLIDGLLLCANKICGIDPINFDGEETDFLSYLLFSDEIGFAFRVSALLATILLVIFTVFMILRTIAKDKSEGTPAHIAVTAFKALVMFFLVPAILVAFMAVGNAFVKALYSATVQSPASIGSYLFSAFAVDGGMDQATAELFRTGALDYNDTVEVSQYMEISNFPSVFALLAGGVILFGIASAMLMFVDRVLSLVILYVVAPISISTSVLDEGARFKLWRDQFFVKFIMGYGMILAINIYALICGLVIQPGFVFFEGGDSTTQFTNLLMKLLVIGGGALTLQKSMALIGNLVSSGAGSNELRDSMSAGSLARAAKGIAGKAFGAAATVTGLRAVKSILSDALSLESRSIASKIVGNDNAGDSKKSKNNKSADGEGSGSKNSDKANYSSNPDATKDAITNPGFKTTNWSGSGGNANNNQPKNNNGNGMLNNAINGGNKGQNKPKEKEGNNENNSQNS